MRRASENNWRKISQSITDLGGAISIPVTIAGSAAFRTTTEGTWERAESVSNEKVVTVRPRITLIHPNAIRHSDAFEITGALLPRAGGAKVMLQRLNAGKWQNVGASTTTDSNGNFVITSSELGKGVVTMQVQIVSSTQSSLSEVFTIVVR